MEERDETVAASLACIAERIPVGRIPRVIVSDVRFGPAVLGIFRPTIVLPKCLLEDSTASQPHRHLEFILAHELMHVRRGDLLDGALQAIVHCLWWFHPCVWFVNRALSRQTERCCDESVIAALGCSPADYARSLLAVIESKQSLKPVPVFPGMKPVEITSQRMERIMSLKHGTPRRRSIARMMVLTLFATIVLPGAASQQDSKTESTAAAETTEKTAGFRSQAETPPSPTPSALKHNETSLVAHFTLLRTDSDSAQRLLGPSNAAPTAITPPGFVPYAGLRPWPYVPLTTMATEELGKLVNRNTLSWNDAKVHGLLEARPWTSTDDDSRWQHTSNGFGTELAFKVWDFQMFGGNTVLGRNAVRQVEFRFGEFIARSVVGNGNTLCFDLTAQGKKQSTKKWPAGHVLVGMFSLYESMEAACRDLGITTTAITNANEDEAGMFMFGTGVESDPGVTGQLGFDDGEEQPKSEEEEPADLYVLEVYNVKDLLGPMVHSQQDPEYASRNSLQSIDDIIELITETVEPGSWDSHGGSGRIQPIKQQQSIVIRQTPEIHDQIAELLGQIRKLRNDAVVTLRVYAVSDLAIGRRGETQVGRPRSASPILANTPIPASARARPPEEVSAVDLAAYEETNSLTTDFAPLVALIRASVEPNSWGKVGRIEPNKDVHGLVIRQTSRAHDQIVELLGALRSGQQGHIALNCRVFELNDMSGNKWLEEQIEFNEPDSARPWALLGADGFDAFWTDVLTQKPRLVGEPKVITLSGQRAQVSVSGKTGYSLQFTPTLFPDGKIVRLEYAGTLQTEMPPETPLSSSLMQSGQTMLFQLNDGNDGGNRQTLVSVTAQVTLREKEPPLKAN